MKVFPLRRWSALVCALLVLPLLAHAARPAVRGESLASLLVKHQKASMTAFARHDTALTQTVYTLTAGEMTGTLTEWMAPKKSRVEMVLGPLRQTDADDGVTAWQQDATGNVRIVRGGERAENRAAEGFSLDSYDPLRRGVGGRVSLRTAREPHTGNYVLDLRPAVGPPQTIYLDPHTFLVRKLVASKGGLAGTIAIDAYTTVAGQKVPARLAITYAGVPLVVNAQLVGVKRLAQVSKALFAVPPTAHDFGFLSDAGAATATVPFQMIAGEVVVPVKINGQARRFVLDSGAGSSFITAKAARDLALDMSGSVPALGYGKAVSSGVATHARLEVPGGVWMDGQSLYVLADPSLAQMLAAHGGIDGGIGYDLLARFTVTVDYKQKTLTFRLPDAHGLVPAGTTSLPLSLANHIPTVTATLGDKHKGRFLVDTGDSGSVHLYAHFARAAGLWNDDTGRQTQTGSGIGGDVVEQPLAGQTLTLGRTRLDNIGVAVGHGPGMSEVSLLAGGIGNAVWHNFRVTFDYADQRLLLEPAGNASGQTVGGTSPAGPVNILAPTDTPPVATPVPAVPSASDQGVGTTVSPLSKIIAEPLLLFTSHAPARAHAFQDAGHAVPATDAATRAVLARHLAALGGARAVAAVTSIRETQTVETGGIKGTVVTVYAAPDKEYDHSELGGGMVDTSEGFDGKTAWRRDTNGNVRPLGGDEIRELKLQLYIDTNSYVMPQFGIPGRVTLRPQREAKTNAYVLDVLPQGGKPSTLTLDPHTFLIVKEQHLDDNVPVTTTFSDYRRVDGVAYPFKQRTTNGLARYDIVGQITKIENNVSVPATLFSPPAMGGSKTQFLTPTATSATVPFDIDNGEISLPVRINGTNARVFLDSGASGLALSAKMATALKLKQQGVLEARGYGGSTDLHPVRIDTFEIPGAVRLSDLAAVSLALPDGFDQSLGEPLAGFIGYDLLSRFVVRIDYGARKLTFTAPSAFQPTAADGPSVPLNLDNDIPSITARFDTLPPAQFLLDTGDVSALRLYGPYVTQNKLSAKYPKQIPSAGGGIGGESRSLLTRTPALTIAGTTLHSLPTEFSLDAKGGASQVLAGSFGSQVLAHFVVTFDYPHGRVFFAPTPSASQPFDTRTFGMIIAQQNDMTGQPHIFVVSVDADSPAARAGVAVYDQILAVDGQPATKLGLAEVRRILSPAHSDVSHTLDLLSTVRVQRTVTVSLYDPLS